MSSVRQALREATATLREAGVASPDVDAAELLALVLGTPRALLLVSAPAPSAEQAQQYADLVARRAGREPLQHLTGTVGFRHVELAVGPGVFVPRPETELLAGWAIEQARTIVSGGLDTLAGARYSTNEGGESGLDATDEGGESGLDTLAGARYSTNEVGGRVPACLDTGAERPTRQPSTLGGRVPARDEPVYRDHPGADEVGDQPRSPVVVDLCTGSGAIAKAVADEVPEARVYAVELDEGAYRWAQRNLAGTGVDLRQGDMADAFEDLLGTVDVVVCNPPYIPLEAWESVAPEARDHDPHLALFSGDDGLTAMRVLERRAAVLLRHGGVVGAEHADVQGESAPAVFAADRWVQVRDHHDLAGRARYLTARLARWTP